jgi:serine/threonine protein kinase
MPAPVDCPERGSWQTLLDETVPAARRRPYEQHLERCPVCQGRLDQTDDCGDELRRLARCVGDPTVTPADPELTQVLDRLLHEGKGPEPPGVTEPDLSFLGPADRPGVLGTLGKYEVWQVLGQGSMGVVLQAFDPALQRLVAVKVLAPVLACSATARRRFARETQAAAAVRHEHVVAVHGVLEADGLPCLIMEYVAGESLQHRLDRADLTELDEVVRIGYETASGLAAAHARGLVHRDIKPANILIEEDTGRVKITDFGLARLVDDVGLTQSGVVAGTPQYMSPEQARGEPIDHRADLFSLGAVLYACCAGVPPFRGPSAVAVLRAVSEEAPAPLRSLNPAVPAWLEALVTRLLAKDPARRLQTAAETAALLEGYLTHLRRPAEVPAPDLPSRPAEARRSRPRLALPVLLFLTALGLGTGALLVGTAGAEKQAPREVVYDFRGRPIPPDFTPFGEDDGEHLHPGPEGLRITVPKTWIHPWGGVGVRSTFGIRGDFQITATVEVLHADTPPGGYGVGVGMRVNKVDPPGGLVTLSRMARAGGRQVLLWDRSLPQPDKPTPKIVEGVAPCTDTAGRLRLKREGIALSYSWAQGTAGEDFQEIQRLEFGDEEVKNVALAAMTGRQPCDVDVRFLELRVQSGGLAVAQPAASPARSGSALLLALAAGLALALGAGLVLWQRRRLAPGQPPEPGAASAVVSFACSGCGKSLRARTELAGRKVKCPQCAAAVRVPEETGA